MGRKLRNIIITIIFLMMCIAIIAMPSEAANLTGKSRVSVAVRKTDSYDVHLSGKEDGSTDDTFCVQNGAHVNTGNVYNIKYRVEIDGLDSVVYSGNGNTVVKNAGAKNNINNGIMAWILAQNDTGSNHVGDQKHYSDKQKAIYGFFGTWKNTNGLNSYKTNGSGYTYTNWINQGRQYANKLRSINNDEKAKIEDKTDKSKITTETYGEYIKVGPFKWEYTGDLTEVKVYNQDKNEISAKIAKYSGKELKTLDDNTKIPSGTKYYVLVKADGKTTSVQVKGKVKLSTEKYTAKIWMLSHKYLYNGQWKEGQNIISTITNKTTDDSTDNVETDKVELLVDLSGYVWKDALSGKGELGKSNRNDLYDADNKDEKGVNGITVYLRDKDGNEIAKTTTKESNIYSEIDGGEYKFKNVEIAKLKDYYVEFEYNGLTYTTVVAHTDKDNGSKGTEIPQIRDDLNKKFESITNGTNISSINSTIEATTKQTPYSLADAYTKQGGTEIRFVNLGLIPRETPKYGLGKDLYNVKLSVNGFNHVYQYDQNGVDKANKYEKEDSDFNVGVRFGREDRIGSYYRAIYKSDANYETADKSKELEVYLTYRIALQNYSGLQGQINEVIEYYDQRYEYVGASQYLKETSQGSRIYLVDDSRYLENSRDDNYNTNGYKKVVINTSRVGKIAGYEAKSIYVTFKLGKEAVLELINNKKTLENVAEINSYTTYDANGNVYAGFDKDSTPGNAVPGKADTYEDDTGVAPSLKLEYNENVRIITGKVFLDSTSGELRAGEIRQGSGAYENGEQGLKDVKVTLREKAENGKVYETTTNEKGDFEFKEFIPGEYEIIYTWGNETYTVQNYKGTVWTDDNKQEKDSKQKNWYNENDEDNKPRYSDAMDDYELRKQIDEETKQVTNSSSTTIKEMNSTTPIMGIGVEETTNGNTRYGITSIETESDGDEFKPKGFSISNVDFGIVERARQELAMQKRVKAMKVTLANGQVIANFTIDEKGKLKGEHNHITYMGPEGQYNGFVKLELDNELIQGTMLEVEYEILAKNNSEKDYLSENFYKYGKEEGELVTIAPSAVVDYLDKDWSYDNAKNSDWTIKTADDIKDLVNAAVYGEDSEINNRTILYTEKLAEKALKPLEANSVSLNVTKVLANSEEINLDNETEVIKVQKTGGSKLTSIPGNYVPGAEEKEVDENRAEEVIVTPSTGDNLAYVLPIAIGLITLAILGTGVVLIKKKVLNK